MNFSIVVIAAVVLLNACFNYWLYRCIRRLVAINQQQAMTIRRLGVNTTAANGKLIGHIDELKVREEAALKQLELFNRYLLRMVKDGLSSENHNDGRSKTKIRSFNGQGKDNIVLHERPGF